MLSSLAPNTRVFLVVGACCGLLALFVAGRWQPVGLHQGYAPEQPIAYSHRLHAGELAIDCLYCHYGARTSRHAGIPPTGLCMNCHTVVSAAFDTVLEERALAEAEGREPRRIVSESMARLYAAMGLDTELQPGAEGPRALEWVKVHNLPDFVSFDHSVHVAHGLACETCHGPVRSMERMRQEFDLSMGWCLDCHRTTVVPAVRGNADAAPAATRPVSTDCAACHI